MPYDQCPWLSRLCPRCGVKRAWKKIHQDLFHQFDSLYSVINLIYSLFVRLNVCDKVDDCSVIEERHCAKKDGKELLHCRRGSMTLGAIDQIKRYPRAVNKT